MNKTQFESLLGDLEKLYGKPNQSGFFQIQNTAFTLSHHEEGNTSWLNLSTEVLVLDQQNTFNAISCALAMNSALFSKQVNPAWFAMMGEEQPRLMLIQRLYNPTLQAPDFYHHITTLKNHCAELNEHIKSLGRQ